MIERAVIDEPVAINEPLLHTCNIYARNIS